MHRAIWTATDDVKIQEGKAIIANITKLKYEIQHDRAITALEDDHGPSAIEQYNIELKTLDPVTWMNVPWLFAECYLYRRLHSYFLTTTQWRSYDVFANQKISTFKSSRPAVVELAAKFKDLITTIQQKDKDDTSSAIDKKSQPELEEAERLLFVEMCEICLWGNATDLSLLTSLSYEDIQKLQGSSARKASENNILVNDLPEAYTALKQAQRAGKAEREVHIILDNAGFELYVDLILTGYLLASGLATRVVLECKAMPWFVSDVVPKDFAQLIDALREPQAFFNSPASIDNPHDQTPPPQLTDTDLAALQFLFEHLTTLHSESQITLRSHQFWTTAGSYWRLPTLAPTLWDDLQNSELVIFKGDLNYRKLVGDAMWDPSTSFQEAIGPLARGRAKILALRTCKADTVVGLPDGKDQELREMDDDGNGSREQRKWAWGGKWAVCEFCHGSGDGGVVGGKEGGGVVTD